MASRNLIEQGWPERTLVKNDRLEYLAKVCIKLNTLGISYFLLFCQKLEISDLQNHILISAMVVLKKSDDNRAYLLLARFLWEGQSINARIHMKGYFNAEDIRADSRLGRDGKI